MTNSAGSNWPAVHIFGGWIEPTDSEWFQSLPTCHEKRLHNDCSTKWFSMVLLLISSTLNQASDTEAACFSHDQGLKGPDGKELTLNQKEHRDSLCYKWVAEMSTEDQRHLEIFARKKGVKRQMCGRTVFFVAKNQVDGYMWMYVLFVWFSYSWDGCNQQIWSSRDSEMFATFAGD